MGVPIKPAPAKRVLAQIRGPVGIFRNAQRWAELLGVVDGKVRHAFMRGRSTPPVAVLGLDRGSVLAQSPWPCQATLPEGVWMSSALLTKGHWLQGLSAGRRGHHQLWAGGGQGRDGNEVRPASHKRLHGFFLGFWVAATNNLRTAGAWDCLELDVFEQGFLRSSPSCCLARFSSGCSAHTSRAPQEYGCD